MCGIAGIAALTGEHSSEPHLIRNMMDSMRHRGPDGDGMVRLAGCDLGFRRLAIIGVDSASQPYCNENESIWSICNGEIYNADVLRAELEADGHRFRTNVDTEVIPHLYEKYGPGFVHHLDGMFAYALFDTRERKLSLGRDRAGEKPLFYFRTESELVFASELRALEQHPAMPRALDPVALRRYLLHGFYPAPLTPFTRVHKLPAAHTLTVVDGKISIERYWDLADAYAQPRWTGRTDDLADEVDQRIGESIRGRTKSDVPIGVLLSGGIDSTTILAHATEQWGRGVQVFSLGHSDRSFDETCYARETAQHYGAEYHEIILSQNEMDEGLHRIGDNLDEPLGDASTIPTHLLSLMARQHVKVVLSGEGGDELFAGYPTYIGDRAAELFQKVPRGIQSALVGAVTRFAPTSMGNVGLDFLLRRFVAGASKDRLARHHGWFGCFAPATHGSILSPNLLRMLEGDDPLQSARACIGTRKFPDGLSELLYTDFSMYLQDDLLTKVDRCSMLASLEVRAPLLDHNLAEFVARLPSSTKLRGKTTKHILRRAGRKRLSSGVLTRRKRGFNIPFSRWLSDGLGETLLDRFSVERLRTRGLFGETGLPGMLRRHLDREEDHGKALFAALAFDLWCDRVYGEGQPVEIGAVGESHGTSAAPHGLSLDSV